MKNELHWFADTSQMIEWYWRHKESRYYTGLKATCRAIEQNVFVICTDQAYYFSQATLARGYRLFAHYIDGSCVEVHLGYNKDFDMTLGAMHDLERLLMEGKFYVKEENRDGMGENGSANARSFVQCTCSD